MELWIRSQNKHSLTQIKSVYVSDDDNNCEDVMGLYSTGHIFLGRYYSKERALEIIDEIQNHIVNIGKTYIKTNENGIPEGLFRYDSLYEMPEE